MSELKIDNPAQRLLDLLKKGADQSAVAYSRDVWRKVLEIPGTDDQLLLGRLASVMALPGRISQVLEDHFPNPRFNATHWKVQTEKAFFVMQLDGLWTHFYSHIDDHTLSELAMLSFVIEERGEQTVIAPEDITGLLQRAAALREEISQSALPPAMKLMLMKQMTQLLEALEYYSITGAEPVMDAVQSALGLAVLNEHFRREIGKDTGSAFGDKISDLLSDVANVVTVAGALPAITVAVNSALTFLGR